MGIGESTAFLADAKETVLNGCSRQIFTFLSTALRQLNCDQTDRRYDKMALNT